MGIEYKANFLWPHEEGSVEQAGYEFANALTEEYRQQWWDILKERAVQAWFCRPAHDVEEFYQDTPNEEQGER